MTEEEKIENTIPQIREFFEKNAEKLKEREFIVFWQSLSEEEKDEFKRTPLK